MPDLLQHRPSWQLPPGVTRGMWEYSQTEHIARDYDDYFAFNTLFEFDSAVLDRHFVRPGYVVDLGCGTGRALVPLVRRGFHGLAVDLSAEMLAVVGEKAETEQLPIDRLRANLVELDCVADNIADYCISMFSTLGMIRGRENRQRALNHVRRILKPGGLFVLHVHNYWYNLYDPGGPWWLVKNVLRSALVRDLECGDKFFDYRRIPNMFLHVFRRRELLAALREARFRVRELIPLDPRRFQALSRPWLLSDLRANGWIVVCE
jgi:SAM-dependent methyltransferase